ncbi:MAG: MlaD family protein [Planctomycetota bacterium]
MNDKHAIAAGLFIIAAIVAALVILSQVANLGAIATPDARYTVDFPAGSDLQGLEADNAVRIMGIDVGKVRKIDLVTGADDDPDVDLVRVRFTVPRKYELHQNAEVSVQSGLTGGSRLNIESLGTGPLADETTPLAGRSVSLSQVIARLGTLVPDARGALAKFGEVGDTANATIQDVRDRIPDLVERYNTVTDKASAMLDSGRGALDNVADITGGQPGSDIKSSLANVKDVTGTLRERIPDTMDKVDGRLDEMKGFIASGRTALDNANDKIDKLGPVLDDGKQITGNVRVMLADNRAKIDRTMTSVQRAADNLEGGIADIRRAPWRLLNKPDEIDEHNLVVYQAAREFANGASDLELTAARLEALAADPNTPQATIVEVRDELVRKYEDFAALQDELWRSFIDRTP